ncbi:MAG: hypothetical protein ACL93V_00720 [Candidatus Electrothrix sp. YB6]
MPKKKYPVIPCATLCCFVGNLLEAKHIASSIISGNRYFLSVSGMASGYFLFSPQSYRNNRGDHAPLLNPAGMTG